MGSSASVQKIDFADLIDAKQRFLTADNATIAITGNFDKDLAFRALRRYFGSWLKADKKVPSTFRQPDPPPTGVLTVESPDSEVSILRFAVRGVARKDKDFAASAYLRTANSRRPATSRSVILRQQLCLQRGYIYYPVFDTLGFTPEKDNASVREKGAADLITKALGSNVTDAEFALARSLFASEWRKRDPVTFWLDADTYKIAGLETEGKAAENVTLADVNTYLEKMRKLPIAAALVVSIPKPTQLTRAKRTERKRGRTRPGRPRDVFGHRGPL